MRRPKIDRRKYLIMNLLILMNIINLPYGKWAPRTGQETKHFNKILIKCVARSRSPSMAHNDRLQLPIFFDLRSSNWNCNSERSFVYAIACTGRKYINCSTIFWPTTQYVWYIQYHNRNIYISVYSVSLLAAIDCSPSATLVIFSRPMIAGGVAH